MPLQMVSSASSSKVETWLRGEPIAHFQPGKVCVVEFWGTDSFVIDLDGRIAFIGHTTGLDEVLPTVLSSSWRMSALRKPPTRTGSRIENSQRANKR